MFSTDLFGVSVLHPAPVKNLIKSLHLVWFPLLLWLPVSSVSLVISFFVRLLRLSLPKLFTECFILSCFGCSSFPSLWLDASLCVSFVSVAITLLSVVFACFLPAVFRFHLPREPFLVLTILISPASSTWLHPLHSFQFWGLALLFLIRVPLKFISLLGL